MQHEKLVKGKVRRLVAPKISQNKVNEAFKDYVAYCQRQGCKPFDVGEYHYIGENQSPHAASIAHMGYLIQKLLDIHPCCEYKPMTITDGIMAAIEDNREGAINTTSYPDDLWARTVSRLLRIMLKHLRSLKREPSRLVFATKEVPAPKVACLKKIIDTIVLRDQAVKGLHWGFNPVQVQVQVQDRETPGPDSGSGPRPGPYPGPFRG